MKRIIFLFLPFLPYLATAQVAKDTVTVLTPAQITAHSPNDTANIYFVIANAWRKANFDSIARYTRNRFQTLTLDSTHIAANGLNLQGTRFTGVLPVTRGGTGSQTQNFIDLTTNQTAAGIKTFSGLVNIGQTSSDAIPLKIQAGSGSGAFSLEGNESGISQFYTFSNDGATLYGYFEGGPNGFQFRAQGNRSISFFTNGQKRIDIKGDGEILIGYTTEDFGAYTLQVKDSVYVGGNVSASAYTTRSDYELKENIQDVGYGLQEVMQLQPVKYTYKSNGSTQLGFIAQDLGVVLPEVVSFENNMAVFYNSIIPVLTKAIQEQQAQIEQLKQHITQLENK